MKKLIIITLLCSISLSAFAWGPVGHELVAQLAFDLSDTATQHKVQHYIGSMSMGDAGNWMDALKKDHKNDSMKVWHYVDFERNAPYSSAAQPNLITTLTRVTDELKNKQGMGDDMIRADVLMLFHLLGDLGQPLHCGYGSDKGGNSVSVVYLGGTWNLHSIWDGAVVNNNNINLKDCRKYYQSLKPAEIANIKKGSFVDWMNESRTLLGTVYNFSHGEITQLYVNQNREIVIKQLVYSAIRLSSVLESSLRS